MKIHEKKRRCYTSQDAGTGRIQQKKMSLQDREEEDVYTVRNEKKKMEEREEACLDHREGQQRVTFPTIRLAFIGKSDVFPNCRIYTSDNSKCYSDLFGLFRKLFGTFGLFRPLFGLFRPLFGLFRPNCRIADPTCRTNIRLFGCLFGRF